MIFFWVLSAVDIHLIGRTEEMIKHLPILLDHAQVLSLSLICFNLYFIAYISIVNSNCGGIVSVSSLSQ